MIFVTGEGTTTAVGDKSLRLAGDKHQTVSKYRDYVCLPESDSHWKKVSSYIEKTP
jgi:hypothetical protein